MCLKYYVSHILTFLGVILRVLGRGNFNPYNSFEMNAVNFNILSILKSCKLYKIHYMNAGVNFYYRIEFYAHISLIAIRILSCQVML